MTPRERLAAFLAAGEAAADALGDLPTVEREKALRDACTLLYEEAKAAAFEVAVAEQRAWLLERHPERKAAAIAGAARRWVATHPELWEALL